MRTKLITASLVATASLLMVGAGCTSSTPTPTPTPTPTKTTNTNTVAINTTPVVTTTNPVVFDAKATDSEILAEVNGQWASTATASSEYGSESWTAKQATGKPNVSAFGDDGYAWAPLEKNGGTETLELTYTKAVSPTGVRIRESYGNGALTMVELKDIDGVYHVIWTGTDTTTGLTYVQVAVEPTVYQANGVRLTFDTSALTDEWVEIDAVQLVGE